MQLISNSFRFVMFLSDVDTSIIYVSPCLYIKKGKSKMPKHTFHTTCTNKKYGAPNLYWGSWYSSITVIVWSQK